jgi:hypothetical protein
MHGNHTRAAWRRRHGVLVGLALLALALGGCLLQPRGRPDPTPAHSPSAGADRDPAPVAAGRPRAEHLPVVTLPVAPEAVPADAPVQIRELAALVEAYRRAIGCPRTLWLPTAASIAQAHSRDMFERRYFAHDSPEGVTVADRLRQGGIVFRRAAENLGVGQVDAEHVLDLWLHSDVHRRNLENCDLTHHGIGYYQARWTHLLVRPM